MVAPVPEKSVPVWLQSVWKEAERALRKSDIWIFFGYSAPAYDVEVWRLLQKGSAGRKIRIYILKSRE